VPLSAREAFLRVRAARGPVWLDAADDADGLGRFSYVACEPDEVLRLRVDDAEPLACMAERLRGRFAIGFLGYDLGRALEPRLAGSSPDPLLPDLAIGYYGAVYRYDHRDGTAEILSVDAEAARRLDRALRSPPRGVEPTRVGPHASDMGYAAYERMIGAALEYIVAGDVYQVNLAHRVRAPLGGDPLGLYLRLRAASPAPLGAFLDLGDFSILSSTPELFLDFDASERRLETRPIKGTRPRAGTTAEDERMRVEVAEDPKERAEHVMIVDLLRNDLGRVAQIGSVRVESLHRVVSLATVHHAVSTISCRVRPDVSLSEMLRAAFPGGSITGAPKIRAMEIIEELEPCPRGPYTGAIGIILPSGSFRFSIAIRTAIAVGGELRFHVGGGIVADSTPDLEWRETWAKAEGFLRALEGRDPAA